MKKLLILLILFFSYDTFSQTQGYSYIKKGDSLLTELQMKLNWGNKYSKELLWASFDSYNMATDLDTNNFVLYDSRLYYLDGLGKYDSGYYLSGSAKVNAFNAAIFEFNQAIELDSNNLLAYTGRAGVNFRMQNYRLAKQDYEKAIELDSNNVFTLYYRARLQKTTKDYLGALKDYSKLIELKPNEYEFYLQRGIIKGLLNDNEGEHKDYTKAADIIYSKKLKSNSYFATDDLMPVNYFIQVFVQELSDLEMGSNQFFSSFDVVYFSNYFSDSIDVHSSNIEDYFHPYNSVILRRKKGMESILTDVIYTGTTDIGLENPIPVWRQTVENNFTHYWDLRDFPFDTQILEISFEGSRDITRKMISDLPDSLLLGTQKLPGSKINSTNLGLKDGYKATEITSSLSFKKENVSFLRKRDKIVPILTYKISIDRTGSWLFIKLFLGSFLGFIISGLAFLIPFREFDSKIELSIGSLFVAIGNMYFVDASMSNIMVLTKADMINNLIIIMITINILLLIVQKNKEIEWNWYEKGYNPIYITSSILFILSTLIILW